MRRAIKHFDQSRLPEGLNQSRYPSYIVQIIPTYSLLWIAMIHDYSMYRNDPAFVKTFFPGIRTVLNWFADRVDDTVLISYIRWQEFIREARDLKPWLLNLILGTSPALMWYFHIRMA